MVLNDRMKVVVVEAVFEVSQIDESDQDEEQSEGNRSPPAHELSRVRQNLADGH
jgi:hypothetical protein